MQARSVPSASGDGSALSKLEPPLVSESNTKAGGEAGPSRVTREDGPKGDISPGGASALEATYEFRVVPGIQFRQAVVKSAGGQLKTQVGGELLILTPNRGAGALGFNSRDGSTLLQFIVEGRPSLQVAFLSAADGIVEQLIYRDGNSICVGLPARSFLDSTRISGLEALDTSLIDFGFL